MNNDFNRDQFLDEINTLPAWVKTVDDMFRYARHLNYRLHESKAKVSFYEKRYSVNEEEALELGKIYADHAEAYESKDNSYDSFFQPNRESFLCNGSEDLDHAK